MTLAGGGDGNLALPVKLPEALLEVTEGDYDGVDPQEIVVGQTALLVIGGLNSSGERFNHIFLFYQLPT